MSDSKTFRGSSSEGFTRAELLVSMALLAILMLVVVGMVDQTGRLWKRTSGKISTFQESRAAFETFTRKVSQAMLNTYWDYDPPIGAGAPINSKYVRQSELHFVTGQSNVLLGGVQLNGKGLSTTGHCIFFQAPLGYTGELSAAEPQLEDLLNASGYFVAHTQDIDWRPKFLRDPAMLKSQTRYRLMELWQPSGDLSVYQYLESQLKTTPASRFEWFKKPLETTPSAARPFAENIIALVISPQRPPNDPGSPLSPDYSYDTKRYLTGSTTLSELTRNQLPPLIQLTLVALDDASSDRLEQRYSGTAPLLQPGALFTDPTKYEEDLYEKLEPFLQAEKLSYRIFSTTVSIRQAKWSD